MAWKRAWLCVAVIALGSASALAQSVTSRAWNKEKLAGVRTFSFATQQRASADVLVHDEATEKMLRQSLTKELLAAGWKQNDSAAEVVIAFYILPSLVTMQSSIPTYDPRPPAGGGSEVTVERQRIRSLVLDLHDPGSQKLLWRGVLSDAATPMKNNDKLQAAIGTLVARLQKDMQKNK
jgi:uncharacterized protein DUF4136